MPATMRKLFFRHVKMFDRYIPYIICAKIILVLIF